MNAEVDNSKQSVMEYRPLATANSQYQHACNEHWRTTDPTGVLLITAQTRVLSNNAFSQCPADNEPLMDNSPGRSVIE
jgi:hypothetical protein